MKLDDIKVNSAVIEAGEWVTKIPELEDLELRVRGVGNADYRKLQAQLIRSLPRSKRADGAIDPADSDDIQTRLLLDTVLLDWRGLTDANGAAIPYSRDLAEKLLTDPDFTRFREAVAFAGSVAGQRATAELEADAKN